MKEDEDPKSNFEPKDTSADVLHEDSTTKRGIQSILVYFFCQILLICM